MHSAGTSACWAAHAKMPRHCPQGQPVWLLFPPRARPTPRPMCWLTRSCPGGRQVTSCRPPPPALLNPKVGASEPLPWGVGKGAREQKEVQRLFGSMYANLWPTYGRNSTQQRPSTLAMHLSSCSTPRGPRMRQDIRGGRRLSLPPAGVPGEDAPSVPPSQDAPCHHHAPSMGLSGSSRLRPGSRGSGPGRTWSNAGAHASHRTARHPPRNARASSGSSRSLRSCSSRGGGTAPPGFAPPGSR